MIPLDAFIFDIGNVLLRFDFQLALRKLAADSDPAAGEILEMIEPVKAAYEMGRISRADFQAQARAILKYTGSDSDFVAAWQDIFTVNEPMVEVLEQLHGRYPLYLLSNTSDLHVDFILERYPFFSLFTDAVYSYVVSASKPDLAIYRIAQKQFAVNPAATLFIDDLLPNVEGARLAGFRAHHYHHDRHADLLHEIAPALSIAL